MALETLEEPRLVPYEWKNEEGWYIDWGDSRIFFYQELDKAERRPGKKWHADRSGVRVTSWKGGGVLVRKKPTKTPGPSSEDRRLSEIIEDAFKNVKNQRK